MLKIIDIPNVWIILGVLSIFLLFIFWRRRNAVWGGFIAGIIFSLTIILFRLFNNIKFDSYIVVKGAIIGVLIGFGAELLGKISEKIRK